MTERMSPKERILATVRGEPVDRPPVSFWGHAYHRESTAQDLAQATLEFQTAHEWDFVKLNPRASYHAETWGVRVRYPGVLYQKPQRLDWPVKTLDDWARIDARTAEAPPLAEQLEAIGLVRRGLPPEVLLVETVFSPLAIAADLAASPAAVLAHLHQDEARVLAAVERIAATFRDFVRQARAAGADGIYFATVDWATRDLLTPEEYSRYARPFDLEVLEAARGATFNLLHVCRRNNLLRELADYPAHAYSWAATEPGNPDLQGGLAAVGGAVAGGIGQEDALQAPGPFAALAQMEKGFELTAGRRWIVAPGCSIPPTTPAENLRAIRRALTDRGASSTASPRART